jgi:hypothetical protein
MQAKRRNRCSARTISHLPFDAVGIPIRRYRTPAHARVPGTAAFSVRPHRSLATPPYLNGNGTGRHCFRWEETAAAFAQAAQADFRAARIARRPEGLNAG